MKNSGSIRVAYCTRNHSITTSFVELSRTTGVEMVAGQGIEVDKHQDRDGVWVRCRGRRDLQPTVEMESGRGAWASSRGDV
jgi:hypothetical protein